jgi:excisionase family DNA binding protein
MNRALAALREPDPREVRPPETRVDRYWRVSDLARQLSLSRQSIYNLIERRELEAVPLLEHTRIPESSILAYLERCRGKR